MPIGAIQLAKNKQLRIFMWGWITYKDGFAGTPLRVTEFCDELTNITSTKDDLSDPTADIHWEPSVCREHNCYDKDCRDYSKYFLAGRRD